MSKTRIEWTDRVWNPVRGCSHVSEGCRNCYAERIAARFSGADEIDENGDPVEAQPFFGFARRSADGPRWTGRVELLEDKLTEPLAWRRWAKLFRRKFGRRPRCFVNSMSDLFHEALPDEAIDRVFAVMALCPDVTFQVLTKRAKRMREYFHDRRAGAWSDEHTDLSDPSFSPATSRPLLQAARRIGKKVYIGDDPLTDRPAYVWDVDEFFRLPLPNVWLGVSVEDRKTFDDRVWQVLETPAAVRFISYEPALGKPGSIGGLDWVVAGGESGPGARPAHPDWFRFVRDQCESAGVPFFFKQWGEWQPFAAEARYAKGSLMPGNDEIVGGDCGGPDSLSFPDPASGKALATWSDGAERLVRYRDEPEHRWGKDGVQSMSYVRVGKKAAGRLLDGREHNEFPEARHGG